MVYCEKCGTENSDNDLFCKKCGNRLEPASANGGQTAYSAPPSPPAQNKNPVHFSGNPAVNALKVQGSSTRYTAAALLFSAMLFFQLISAFQGIHAFDGNGLFAQIEQMAGSLGVPLLSAYTDTLNRVVVGFRLLSLVPTIFILAGMWILYSACRDQSTDGVAATGATIIKVVTIIQLVFTCLLFLLVETALIVGIVQLSSASNSIYPSSAYISTGLLILCTILIAGIGAAVILYNVSILSVLGSVKEVSLTRRPAEVHFASYLGVINFIMAVFSVIGGALSGSALGFFSNAFYAAFLILTALLVFAFRDSMKSMALDFSAMPQQENV